MKLVLALIQQNGRHSLAGRSTRSFSAGCWNPQQFGPSGQGPGYKQDWGDTGEGETKQREQNSKGSDLNGSRRWKTYPMVSKVLETAATTVVSIAALAVAGYSYHRWYKWLVLRKMENAFAPGDPVLVMASGTHSPGGVGSKTRSFTETASDSSGEASEESAENWIPRPEQTRIDEILSGKVTGRYHLLIGEKGTGKSSMLIEAMRKVDGEGVSMFEAHADPEIFRIRLGKALDFEFQEDYIGSLFSIRGPRDTTALLDVERAFNKLEKIALKRRQAQRRVGEKLMPPRPLVLIVNGTHLIRDDEDGQDLLEMMQQRAEAWAAANLVTMVFNSDDYWVYERLKRYATRMDVLPVLDLPKDRAIAALSQYRIKYHPDSVGSSELLEKVFDRVGGRLSYLNRVAKSRDMLAICDRINVTEKTWFLNKCWILGEWMDDDVMDQQKYASAAMVLAKALVDQEKELPTKNPSSSTNNSSLPQIPLHVARQIMTRADFVQSYDHDNIFTIDSNAMVRADSVPMMNAFREICSEPGFEEHLGKTLDRINAIESLGRTRELTLKDLWTIQSGEKRGRYAITQRDSKGRELGTIEFRMAPDSEDK